jgi:signal peptidase I
MVVREYREILPPQPGVEPHAHMILEMSDDQPYDNTPEFVVPPGHVFAMGDNRDNSQDSRVLSAVGYIPVDNLVGRAEFIFFSVGTSASLFKPWTWPTAIRWTRLFSAVR